MTETRSQLERELAEMTEERDALNEQIKRYQLALAALDGTVTGRPRSGSTARTAILAALGSYTVPVHTSTLLDHESLVHYSRHTLRTALADLHHAGAIDGERGPKGFIWNPASVSVNGGG